MTIRLPTGSARSQPFGLNHTNETEGPVHGIHWILNQVILKRCRNVNRSVLFFWASPCYSIYPRTHRIPMMTCLMFCHSNSDHLSQVFTAFALPYSRGEIRLSQECKRKNFYDPGKPHHLRDARGHHLMVAVDRDTKVYYDCRDSPEIDEPAAEEFDCYFTRSYAPSAIADRIGSAQRCSLWA